MQVCLLSAQAGGAGLNLIGANRLVLLDSNWLAPVSLLHFILCAWQHTATLALLLSPGCWLNLVVHGAAIATMQELCPLIL